MSQQQTLAKPGSLAGTSLHTGEKVKLTLRPAPAGTGFVFKRVDMRDEPTIAARIEHVKQVERATTIAEGSVKVHTVEHVLSALCGLGVDNAVIEMDANEPPIGDGSALPYVELIQQCGVVPQEAARSVFEVREPLHVETKGGSLLTIVPDDKFRLSVTQVGPDGMHTQYLSLEVTPETYAKEIAPARTFTYLRDIQPLLDKGLIKGGALDNAIVIQDDGSTISTGALRFKEEFVRHKMLDLVGDLALFGRRIRGHVIAVKPGHGPNAELTRALAKRYALMQSLIPAPFQIPTGEAVLDINEIMRLLPHRHPFLLLDRVISFEGEMKLTALKNVTVNEPFFPGHFPNYPVMPGVLQVEAMAQAASILMLRQGENAGKMGFFMSADEVKFRKPVLPGDTLLIHVEVVKARRSLAKAKCHCTVAGAIVSEAEVTISLMDR
ncbi:MAG: bifunctional UDP-3-O-[3-hydroxymyristoyl] N-acetylglucosamine deacetylase/3-hydroxyacyl-ACP dehydratase [Verrucomicrobia bacterium]|nr:bifunctional UDP-3-O-[3-hydroxymyristoyl] N-acetylglucosamine deacetylase/3-hydroxyacyl-ACP dehydratase [Verrucomicrobiota bacterium]